MASRRGRCTGLTSRGRWLSWTKLITLSVSAVALCVDCSLLICSRLVSLSLHCYGNRKGCVRTPPLLNSLPPTSLTVSVTLEFYWRIKSTRPSYLMVCVCTAHFNNSNHKFIKLHSDCVDDSVPTLSSLLYYTFFSKDVDKSVQEDVQQFKELKGVSCRNTIEKLLQFIHRCTFCGL